MTNNIELQKLKDKYPKVFKQVPSNLLEFIFAKETSSKIAEICLKNKVEDEEKIKKISYFITLTLLKQTPEESLTENLEKEVKLSHETARNISIEVKTNIFSQIQESRPIKTGKGKNSVKKDQPTQSTNPSPPTTEKKESKKSSIDDTYRESI